MIRFRPVIEADLQFLARFSTDPECYGLDWRGFGNPVLNAKRFADNGFFGEDYSRLMVLSDDDTTGFVGWSPAGHGKARFWEIGIALVPEFRGRGIGWRAQAMLCDYLFAHTPNQRIQATTDPENIPEQKALVNAGFKHEGVLRASNFSRGQWRDLWVYSRLRDDPEPTY